MMAAAGDDAVGDAGTRSDVRDAADGKGDADRVQVVSHAGAGKEHLQRTRSRHSRNSACGGTAGGAAAMDVDATRASSTANTRQSPNKRRVDVTAADTDDDEDVDMQAGLDAHSASSGHVNGGGQSNGLLHLDGASSSSQLGDASTVVSSCTASDDDGDGDRHKSRDHRGGTAELASASSDDDDDEEEDDEELVDVAEFTTEHRSLLPDIAGP